MLCVFEAVLLPPTLNHQQQKFIRTLSQLRTKINSNNDSINQTSHLTLYHLAHRTPRSYLRNTFCTLLTNPRTARELQGTASACTTRTAFSQRTPSTHILFRLDLADHSAIRVPSAASYLQSRRLISNTAHPRQSHNDIRDSLRQPRG